jgi:hypothetical protein
MMNFVRLDACSLRHVAKDVLRGYPMRNNKVIRPPQVLAIRKLQYCDAN